ncbi:MAG: hypothetical protein ABFR05_05955 [Bacteroidota bacterium]
MKKVYFIIAVIGITFLSTQSTFAQVKKSNELVYKTTVTKTPQKVKETLKGYSNYKVSNEVTFTNNGEGKLYKVKVQKGAFSHYVLIDEKGKVKGIETGEHREK